MRRKTLAVLICMFAMLFALNGVWAQEGDFSFLEGTDNEVSSTGSSQATEAIASGSAAAGANAGRVSEEPTASEFPWQGRVTAYGLWSTFPAAAAAFMVHTLQRPAAQLLHHQLPLAAHHQVPSFLLQVQ
jgi:hypothetical protein